MNSPVYTEKNGQNRPQLTQEDVRGLLKESEPNTRAAVARKIAADHEAGHFRENELLVAEQIFRLLLRDAEVAVRATLADSLKQNPHAPRDVILKLAADVDEVARPVLEKSSVLQDDDLMDIIRSHEEITKHIAIANREQVSSMVSTALVETRNENVVRQLVNNDGANISEHSLKRIVQDHSRSDAVISGMAARPNLPVTVVENLLSIVSESVAQELKNKYSEVASRVEREAQRVRETMTLRLLDTTLDAQSVHQLVNQLYDEGRLTPSLIFTSLCRGNFGFFEESLARMANIPLANAHKLISDKGDLGFRSLYKKAGLPDSMFEACRLVLVVMHEMNAAGDDMAPGTIHFANRVVEKILIKVQGREVDNLAYIIALIRQNVR